MSLARKERIAHLRTMWIFWLTATKWCAQAAWRATFPPREPSNRRPLACKHGFPLGVICSECDR